MISAAQFPIPRYNPFGVYDHVIITPAFWRRYSDAILVLALEENRRQRLLTSSTISNDVKEVLALRTCLFVCASEVNGWLEGLACSGPGARDLTSTTSEHTHQLPHL